MKMITIVDTCILIDILDAKQEHHLSSIAKLKKASATGELVISIVTYGELSSGFLNQNTLDSFLATMNIFVVPVNKDIIFDAGLTFALYKKRRYKQSKEVRKVTLLGDFAIGSTARVRQFKILTRDDGVFKTYYSDIKLVD